MRLAREPHAPEERGVAKGVADGKKERAVGGREKRLVGRGKGEFGPCTGFLFLFSFFILFCFLFEFQINPSLKFKPLI
jgi:hypothetical protein